MAAAQDIQREDVITEVDGKPGDECGQLSRSADQSRSAPRHSALPRSKGSRTFAVLRRTPERDEVCGGDLPRFRRRSSCRCGNSHSARRRFARRSGFVGHLRIVASAAAERNSGAAIESRMRQSGRYLSLQALAAARLSGTWHRYWPCVSSHHLSVTRAWATWQIAQTHHVVVMLIESRNGPWAPTIGNFFAAHDDVVRRIRIREGQRSRPDFPAARAPVRFSFRYGRDLPAYHARCRHRAHR